jgi:hypothetical protein
MFSRFFQRWCIRWEDRRPRWAQDARLARLRHFHPGSYDHGRSHRILEERSAKYLQRTS